MQFSSLPLSSDWSIKTTEDTEDAEEDPERWIIFRVDLFKQLPRSEAFLVGRRQSRHLMSEIRRVLMNVWDPIGVKEIANAQDEYDSYIGGIYHLLRIGASDERIQEHLWLLVTETMGLSGARKGDMAETVRALRQINLSKTTEPGV
jgi:hypothetical protein